MNKLLLISILGLALGCSKNKLEEKGFPVPQQDEEQPQNGLTKDSTRFETRPVDVLLTGNPEHRLIPLYKVNYYKKTKESFTGSNNYHFNYSSYGESAGNQWNNNYMPGFEAVYGYNMVNISHFNNIERSENKFFEKPVLIKTLYYPSFSKDTLNNLPVLRKYYMVSTYDEDTNKDGFINLKDLRRFYFLDLDGKNKTALIPSNYSVLSSEYDPANDYMYLFATLDQNKNGTIEDNEAVEVFWVNLKNPAENGKQYSAGF